MAVTNNRKEEPNWGTPVVQGQTGGTTAAATPKYTGMAGVSGTTAQKLASAQKGYTAGDRVTAAQNTLQQIQANKPQGYTSKYQPMLDDIMQQIQNPGKFNYEFNGDNLFKGYADMYTQKGKQASLDAMGQAAGLTGGYGNSYAQAAGNQAYQQNLLSLYDRGLDLHDRAYQKYQDNLTNLQNRYGLLQGADETDYGRYRDTVADWTNEEQQAYNRMMDAQNMDYTMYQNDLNYWTGLAQVENAAWQTEQQRQEAIRQYNQNYASDMALRILANGQMPSAELLAQAGLSEADARAMMAQVQATGGGGGTNRNAYKDYVTDAVTGDVLKGLTTGAGNLTIPAAGETMLNPAALNGMVRLTTEQNGNTLYGSTPKTKTTSMSLAEYYRKLQEDQNKALKNATAMTKK